MPEPKKHFTQAFRDEAVRLVQTSGRSRRAIAEDLGIGLSTLRHWIDARRGRALEEPPADRQEDVARRTSPGGRRQEDVARRTWPPS